MSIPGNFSPKLMQYSPDGRGRDTYISFNNGGIYHQTVKVAENKQGHTSHFFPPLRSNTNGKPFRYHSDGTGRDSYIIMSNSGLIPYHNSNPIRLRDYPKLSPKRTTSNSWIPRKEQIKLASLARQQKDLSEKLYSTCRSGKFMPCDEAASTRYARR